MEKLKIGIIGTGNIGTDLLVKSSKSNFLDPVIFVGRRETSDGIKLAKSIGINTSTNGLDFFINNPKYCDLVFDCTNAISAVENYNILKHQRIRVIDLTPAKLGAMCIPTINPTEILSSDNINMVTCGGQASIPLLHEISLLSTHIEYIEIVSQVSSKSAGIATRVNIDQYIDTTESAIKQFTKCKECKVILNLNPADPCVDMQTTMFIKAGDNIIYNTLLERLTNKIQEIKKYVPNYNMTMIPIMNEDGILILSVKVIGAGDYLPPYAGNLDIINCAAIEVARIYHGK